MKSQTTEIKWDDLVQLNRHQVFTGAVNPGDHCFSVGYLNTTSFIVYGSGTNLVILTCNLDTLQIIPGIKYGNIQVGCVECSSSEGMVRCFKCVLKFVCCPNTFQINEVF